MPDGRSDTGRLTLTLGGEAGHHRGMEEVTIGRILLADDGSDAAGKARLLAVEMAASTRAKLSIVYVLEPFQEEALGRYVAAKAVELADERGVPHDVIVEAPIGVTNPGRRIIHAAESCGADLIVIGARGLGGVGRILLGSVSNYVVNHAGISVLVAR